MMNMVDEFIFLDDVQYTKRDWRNRNLIKTSQGTTWLTIPVESHHQQILIKDIHAKDDLWRLEHWKTIVNHYIKAPFFKRYETIIKCIYSASKERNLCMINTDFATAIMEVLGIHTKLSYSSDYSYPGTKTEKLIGICKKAGATHYLSGPAAKNYLKEDWFEQEGIQVEWMDYENYPTYHQLYGNFTHHVSILDLIFNEGPNSIKYMKSFPYEIINSGNPISL
jgi:glutaredoxin-related protein